LRAPETWLQREGRLSVIVLLAVVVLFSALPFGRLVWAALVPGGVPDVARALEVVSGRAAALATWNTLESSLLSALGAAVLGTAMALAVSLTDVRAKRAIGFLFVMSMLMAPQVVALGFLMLTGPSSPLLVTLGLAPPPGSGSPLIGKTGVILLLALHHAPLVFVTMIAGLKTVPRDVAEAAAVFGTPARRLLVDIVLPLLLPHLVAATLLAFVAAVGNFGIPALLGMPVNYLTLPTLIYRRLSSFGPSIIGDAAALSLLVAAIAGAGVAASVLALRKGGVRLEAGKPLGAWFRLGRWRPAVEAAIWLLILLVLALPIVSLLTAALVPTYGVPLTPATVTLANFAEVLFRQQATARAFGNSFVLSAIAAVVLALLAILIAYALDRGLARGRGTASALIEVPYALPGIVLAIACILLFLRPLPLLNVSLYGTAFIILFAYFARFLPLALKPTMAALSQLSRDQEEAAAVHGARFHNRFLDIVVPAVLPAAVAGGLLVFLTAFNELTVSALLWASGTETLGVVLFNLEEAGLASEASAVAIAATAVIALVMLVLDRAGRHLPEGVLPWRV
jgi:iron(III) transport system permease protein